MRKCFNCYDPTNMQTRYMTCHRGADFDVGSYCIPGWFCRKVADGHCAMTASDLQPSLEEATTNMRRLHWVGITEFYLESLCLLAFQVYHALDHAACTCSGRRHLREDAKQGRGKRWRKRQQSKQHQRNEEAKEAGKEKGGQPPPTSSAAVFGPRASPKGNMSFLKALAHPSHESHHVSKHDVNSLPHHVLEQIDVLTATDATLYITALRRFLKALDAMEQEVGVWILCPQKVNRFLETLGGSLPMAQEVIREVLPDRV
mmetsp:Transcript_17323/g.50541  ORF Transcript_17323/g.50541 Transcript_17323/m.50541 type:complete len:259 (-) Transcript_17323:68-844(-)